jgi:hypothetical protein
MTAVAEIIERGFFEAALTSELQHATPTQTTRAMTTLSTLVKFLYGTSAGESLTPFPLGNVGVKDPVQFDCFDRIPQNSMLIASNEAPLTVYLPPSPSDGARVGISDPFNRLQAFPITVTGNGRAVDGQMQQVVETNGANPVWFYRADLSAWVRIAPLLITDPMPFPEEFDEMFVLLLAMRLNPVYARDGISQAQAGMLGEMRQQFVARYLQSSPLEINPDIAFMSRQSFDNGITGDWSGGSTAGWNRGRVI